MRNYLKKISLVTAFAVTLTTGIFIGYNSEQIFNSFSTTAVSEQPSYSVEHLVTIEDYEEFVTYDSSGTHGRRGSNICMDYASNTFYYIDGTSIYSYNLNQNTKTQVIDLLTDGIIEYYDTNKISICINPYNNQLNIMKLNPYSDGSGYVYTLSTQNNTYVIENQIRFDSAGDFPGIYQHYFYDENTLYLHNSRGSIKFNMSDGTYERKNHYYNDTSEIILNSNIIDIDDMYGAAKYSFNFIFENNNNFYNIVQRYSSSEDVPSSYYVNKFGTFVNDTPEIKFSVPMTEFYSEDTVKDYKDCPLVTIYNEEPYIFNAQTGTTYKVNMETFEIETYLDGNTVTQDSRSYFSDNMTNFLMSKYGEPVFYDQTDHTIKIFRNNSATEPETDDSKFDVNCDGKVSSDDALAVLQKVVGLE